MPVKHMRRAPSSLKKWFTLRYDGVVSAARYHCIHHHINYDTRMAELAVAIGLGPIVIRRVGSSPTLGTIYSQEYHHVFFFQKEETGTA